MAGNRKFSKAFKSQVVEEFLAGGATQAQLARRYGVSDNLILQWRRRYAAGKLEDVAGPTDKEERIKELERMVGRLTMENELLKKGVRFALLRGNERSSTMSGTSSNRSNGGAE
jgi:transposase